MTEADIKAFYQQPWVMVASDGGIDSTHPRGAGTFPRVLGVLVREKHWLTLPEAIRKMTRSPAQRLGWKDRGVLREGAFADLVLFNPNTVRDRSTFAEPALLPVGHRESLRQRRARLEREQGHWRTARARVAPMSLRSRLFACQPIEMLTRHPASSPLPRTLGLFSLTCFGVGSTIGAGIFVLTGVVAAEHAGPAVVLALVLASIAAHWRVSVMPSSRRLFRWPAAPTRMHMRRSVS